jgi:hypothetical protein
VRRAPHPTPFEICFRAARFTKNCKSLTNR